MWAGQLACEAFNWVLKRLIKQERPAGEFPSPSDSSKSDSAFVSNAVPDSLGNGYGFPSSHSQYMAYFSSFLIMHLFFRHRFVSCGYKLLDALWKLVVYLGLVAWASVVCYSR